MSYGRYVRAAVFFAMAALPGTILGQGRGMGAMMGMGMGRDSTTRALMAGSHDLVMNHDRITRTVTNLPNGVRTVTESDDPRIAELIRMHVATSVGMVEMGKDPGLPMETKAVRTIFANKDKVRTSTEPTPKGVIVTQTSTDSVVVAALHRHAADVSELVRDGMAAMHRSMMRPDTAQSPPAR